MNRTKWMLVGFLSVALLPLGWGQQVTDPKGKVSPVTKAVAANRQLLMVLQDAQEALKTINDKRARERLELLLSRAELRANDVQKELAALLAASKPTALSEEDFTKILAGLKSQSFDKDKVPFIENLGKSRYYTCAQLRALLKEFSFDDGRGKAAVALYPQIIDPDNFFTVLEVFTFDSGRKAVRDKLKLK